MTAGAFQFIRCRSEGKVAVIAYDRQDRRNAWHVPMYREIVAAIEAANADGNVGAIVITHEGPAFCSGTDLKAPREPVDPATGRSPNIATEAMALDRSWLHLLARSKPVVGAIRGRAIGLGVTQILPFAIRIGGVSSRYSFPFLQLGTMPELGSTALLPRLVGYGRALHICLTSAELGAVEAERIGLIGEVVPDAEVMTRAIEVAGQIAGYPPLQLNQTLALFDRNAAQIDRNAVLARETEAFVAMLRAARQRSG
jgi:enoyl-CoA hydratase/carnithine racemase